MSLKILNILLCAILVSIIGNCISGSCSQSGDGIMENSNNNTSENIDNISQRAPLTFGPGTLEELKNNPDFIAAYGSIPAFATSEERDKWIDTLGTIIDGINANFDQEMYKNFSPNGPVTGYGVTIDGVIQVGINKSNIVDKPFMDEIYQIFDSKAIGMGIKEVPVVFVHEDNPIPITTTETSVLGSKVSKGVVEKTANLSTPGEKGIGELNSSNNNDSNSINESISNVKNSSGNKPSTTNSAPGFGLLGSLTCLYIGWRLRKK